MGCYNNRSVPTAKIASPKPAVINGTMLTPLTGGAGVSVGVSAFADVGSGDGVKVTMVG